MLIRQFILVLGLLLLVALNAEARTYIQCAGTADDRTVINLDGENSTLFMTTGLADPDEIRVLKELIFLQESDAGVEYVTADETLHVLVPKHAVDRIVNGFEVILTFLDADQEYAQSCFSNVF